MWVALLQLYYLFGSVAVAVALHSLTHSERQAAWMHACKLQSSMLQTMIQESDAWVSQSVLLSDTAEEPDKAGEVEMSSLISVPCGEWQRVLHTEVSAAAMPSCID